ncbi:MAG: peptidylprolyl isomerase [Ignavibacteriales bacterium]|nr:peptidylprolyl isomerase [Ignavibacteriales bacterium]
MKKYFLVSVLLFVNPFYFAQDNEKEVAKIGSTSINSQEFIERFEMTPRLGPQSENNLEFEKKDFLYTLIAEKLWAKKAKEMKLDTLEIIKTTTGILERMYVRDALYKIEVLNKATIPDQELIKGIFRNQVMLKVNFAWSKDKKYINDLYNALNDGLSFDSLLTDKDSVMDVTFGQMQEPVEDSLYKLLPGKYTAPIQAPTGDWFIFRVNSREKNIPKEEDLEKTNSNVKKIVKERIIDKFYRDFYVKFFGGIKINAKGYLFWSFADKAIKVIVEKKQKEKIADNEKIYLNDYDIAKIKHEFGSDTLKQPFIAFEKDPVPFGQFLDEFAFEGFFTTTTDSNKIKAKLYSRVKNFIEHELLTREGYKRGLQNLPEVKTELKMWSDYYLSQIFRTRFLDSAKVTDNEVYNYYKSKNKEILIPKQVNIIEVLTDSLEVIEKVLDGLKNGQDMRELAKKYTQRKWTKDKDGEFGFFPVTMYGDIGRISSSMEIGEVYGPLKLPEGYSIFKLIDKKDASKEEPKPFEDIKDDVKKNLMASKLQNSIVNYTVKLANEYGVSVDETVLKQIKVTYIVMFAYRYMGFGGRIVAVPMSPPFNDWVNQWLKSKKDLP